MKFSTKWFYLLALVLSAGVTEALSLGLVPAAYVPFVAGASTLLASLLQKVSK
jgi:hypothetical protein